ncbi:MAG: DMT family transporter [Roseinatronobacter sp.]
MPQPPTRADWIGVIALGLIWGASFMAISVALQGLSPLWITTARIAIGALTLGGIAWALGVRITFSGPILAYAGGMGLLSNIVPFYLLSLSQQHVTSGFAGITMAAIPLFVIGLAHLMVAGERLTGPKAAGFAMGLIGVGVLIGPGIFERTGAELETLASLGCLAAALSYALGSIVTRNCPEVHPVGFGLLALGIATLLLAPVALVLEGLPVRPELRPALAVLYLGLLPTGYATYLLVGIIRRAGPSFLAQVNYHVPVWSVLLGVLVLGEALPGQFLLALGVILAGLMLSRRRTLLRPRAPA